MIYKKLAAFYFGAEELNKTMDNLCFALAAGSAAGDRGCEYYAERICRLIAAKCELQELWAYLDGKLRLMTEKDGRALRKYASLRKGISRLAPDEQRELHRAVVKFSRRLGGVEKRFPLALRTLCEYYCFVRAAG